MKCRFVCVKDGSIVIEEIDLSKVVSIQLEAGLGRRISIEVGKQKLGFDIRALEGDIHIMPHAPNAIRLDIRRGLK